MIKKISEIENKYNKQYIKIQNKFYKNICAIYIYTIRI